eukprot:5493181-Amphidinium_carterae.1
MAVDPLEGQRPPIAASQWLLRQRPRRDQLCVETQRLDEQPMRKSLHCRYTKHANAQMPYNTYGSGGKAPHIQGANLN